MKKFIQFFCLVFWSLPVILTAQQNVVVISKCGGVDTVTIPTIVDNDHDGMDDALEQRLLNHFIPVIIQFDNEHCPGPALDGTGDSNLVVARIYPIPQQYTFSSSLDSVLTHPVALVPKKGLVTGMIWYNSMVKVTAACLYGQDCGLNGHTADVEGFSFSLRYTGPDTVAGWMYDTVLQNWMGVTIQTVSHANTICEQTETHPYKSDLFPNGLDTVYASPDKHGNYLTISGCGSSFICNPGCGGIQSRKKVRNINVGEPNATLVADLGTLYPAYAGEDPWSASNFLASHGGNAGPINHQTLKPLTSDFIQGTTLTSHAQICNIYSRCFANGSSFSDYSCSGSVYNFFNQQLTLPGTYYHTLTSSYGCDSTIALTLSLLPVSAYSYQASVCNGDSYNFNGHQINQAGVYHDTLTNIYGCDSAVTLTLDVNFPVTHSYNASLCLGSSYNFNGQVLSSPGLYQDTLTTSAGCDSIIHLSLIVDTLPVVTWSFNIDTISPSGHAIFLTGGSPAGGVYSGAGVNGNIFYPDSAGIGSHVIIYTYTDGLGCSGTASSTITILVSAINEVQDIANSIQLYPNPAHEVLQLVYTGNKEPFHVTIQDTRGEVLRNILAEGNAATIDISQFPSGVYFLQLTERSSRIVRKFVVE